ncbi:MAG: SemiSWEET family transporter [Vulcanimicrobiaceae bacterium]
MLIDAVGIIATVFVVIATLPQLYALVMLPSSTIHGPSLPMFVLYTLGAVSWLAYGLLERNPAIIVTNIFTTFNGVTITTILLLRSLQQRCVEGP